MLVVGGGLLLLGRRILGESVVCFSCRLASSFWFSGALAFVSRWMEGMLFVVG